MTAGGPGSTGRTVPGIPPGPLGALAVLAFACEVALLVLTAVVGWRLGQRLDVPSRTALSVVVAIVLVVAVVVVWARWNAPRSASRLPWPQRYLTQLAPFVVVGLLAAAVGLGWWGAVLAFLAAVAFGVSRGGESPVPPPPAD
ncbi:DUF2568 domain-containing protein [Cellulomonas sp. DKR-3]|uniref:DUF2568 domain-containing protein n=1 Tax=Cellulomonas fulva TaxID=2835530 RepID=A0ABS5TUK0_9CELL|nr:YrdB family protein [Cellulomonas fulva]MBT0992795.1 DUF2568 domain-containing protein [Cellulomonas fulva]